MFCCCTDKTTKKINKLNKLVKKIDGKLVNIDKEIMDLIKRQNYLNNEKEEYQRLREKYNNTLRELKLKQ